MKRILKYPFYIKSGLVIIALGLSLTAVFYTSVLVSELEARQKKIAQIWASALEKLASGDSDQYDISFIFDEIVQSIDFPVIVTDSDNKPIDGFYKNIAFDSLTTDSMKLIYLSEKIIDFDLEHDPILVSVNDTIVLQKIHFGNSPVIDQLKWFPYIQIIAISLYILLGYAAFSVIRKQEQSSVWVGMSKETAHQLGTPLSGLLAWIEILKSQELNTDQLSTVSEMENDLQRLMTVTDRFSKIGARPKIEKMSLTTEINHIVKYAEKRFFTSGRKGAISIISDKNYEANLNSTLFQWAIENIIKNALDAASFADPNITIIVSKNAKWINIDIEDNGKGIPGRQIKDVFRPGFTTKERGWGMGLSLTKRIIEDYHQGRISVLWSVEGKGTCFRIQLRA